MTENIHRVLSSIPSVNDALAASNVTLHETLSKVRDFLGTLPSYEHDCSAPSEANFLMVEVEEALMLVSCS